MANFEMVGKLSIGKESDKFHPYTDTVYDSGWEKKRLMFNVRCGDNNHLLTIDAGAFKDGKGYIYSFSKGSIGEDGKKIKGESLKIPFKERLTSKLLPEVAEFKKFVFDLEVQNRRYKLEKIADKIKDGISITDEELKSVGLESEEQIAIALENSHKKHHEFISEWDFIDFVKETIDSEKYTDKKFFIRGNIEHSYSEKNGKVYENYVPNRIYLADDETEEISEATINLVYNKDSLDGLSVEENGKYFVNGYQMSYENNRKTKIPVPTTIVIPVAADDADEKEKKKVEIICKKFEIDDDSYKELGVVVNMINGAQRISITKDMLTDEQREDLEYGLITEKDIAKDLGSSAYGDRVKEYSFVKLARGYTKGRKDTVFSDKDMIIPPLVEDLFEDEL